MPLDPSYILDNATELEHLRSLADHLTDEELAYPLEAGWTVSAVLAHLGFWDHRAAVLLEKWEKDGVGPSPIDIDVVNEGMRLHCLAIPPRSAAELAFACAEQVDRIVEQLSPEMLANVEKNGKTVRLNRALHRQEHLAQIEKALGIADPPDS